MDLVVPRFAAGARAGQQHVVTLERSRGGGRRPGRHDRHGPVGRCPATLRSAAPNAIEQAASMTRAGHHYLRVPGILSGHAAQLNPQPTDGRPDVAS